MRIEEIWWKRLTNPSNVAEDIAYSVLDGKSAFVLYKNEIAWKDELIQNIVENIEKDSPNMKTTIDVPESHSEPNEYILRKYCGDDEERSKYWPSAENTVAKFLARNPRAVLNRSNVILDMVYSKTPEKWIDFAEEYHSYFDEYDEQHGALVLFIKDGDGHIKEYLKEKECRCEIIDYDANINDFDMLMLCMTILSEQNCSIQQKQYIAETASALAGDNVMIAGKLAEYKGSLPVNTLNIAKKIFRENNIPCDDIETRVKKSLWKAQVKILFPIIEQFRSGFISENPDRLKGCSLKAYKTSNIFELEIGQLYHLCMNNDILTKKELKFLEKVKDARNSIAHLDVVAYNDVISLMDKCTQYME